MPKYDFDGTNRAALAALRDLVTRWLPGGHFEGNEYKCGDITGGKGRSLSVNVVSGKWKDFSSQPGSDGNDGGKDPISLKASIAGVSMGEAHNMLRTELGLDSATPYKPTPRPKEEEKERPAFVTPIPANSPPRLGRHWKHGTPSHWYEYRNTSGELTHYVARFDAEDGGKECLPCSLCRYSDGRISWEWLGPKDPELRPIYGAEKLASRPGASVLWLEGEGKTDAVQAMFPELVVLSWMGGSGVGKKALVDLAPVKGRRHTLFPDADLKVYKGKHHPKSGEVMPRDEQPGQMAMVAIGKALSAQGDAVRLVRYPDGVKDGWDLKDAIKEGWDRQRIMDYIRANLRELVPDDAETSEPEPVEAEPPRAEEPPPVEAPPVDEIPYDEPGDYGDDDSGGERPDPTSPPADRAPFSALGYDRGCFNYLVRATGQIARLPAGAHTAKPLLQLAPLQFWEVEFPGKQSGVDWDTAANFCMRQCENKGIFDPSRMHGRGCWWDAGRMVFHLGDRLLVDGKEHEPSVFNSRYFYERAFPIAGPADPGLTAKESREIIDIAKRFAWDMPASAALLAGWIALAPVCGALKWRPHIWLNGGPGTGKSTILEYFIGALMGGTEIRVQGSSTEAGIRQTLRADARPVLIDETEQNNEREQNRMQAILALIRQSSSEGGAQTLRGSATGEAIAFHVRSMFCLSSVQVGIKHQADHTRIAVLSLRGTAQFKADEIAMRQAMWKETERILGTLRQRENFAGRLIARTVRLMPVITKNVRVFIAAAAEFFSNQRLGDQYGTLLAGCYSLISDEEATREKALELIGKFQWSTYTEAATDDDSDECLSAILQAQVRVENMDCHGETLTLGELCACVAGRISFPKIDKAIASETLARNGLRIKDDALKVANKSEALGRILKDRPFATDWKGYLKRVAGAKPDEKPCQFAPGHLSRCVSIPLSKVLPETKGAV